jgi:hypothetical protein
VPIAIALLPAITLGVLRVLAAIFLPVLGIALRPRTLGAPLVFTVVGVSVPLVLLPAPTPFSLAALGLTKALPRSLGFRHEHLPARSTAPLLHRLPLRNPDYLGRASMPGPPVGWPACRKLVGRGLKCGHQPKYTWAIARPEHFTVNIGIASEHF